eukprot:scaffold368228_cov15-Prasinocladus_malaysianus.AAC.1
MDGLEHTWRFCPVHVVENAYWRLDLEAIKAVVGHYDTPWKLSCGVAFSTRWTESVNPAN